MPKDKSQSDLFKEEAQKILDQLKIKCPPRCQSKIIKEYNQKVKETERWLNSRFEVIMQTSSPSKPHNMASSQSVANFAKRRILLKNGSSIRSKIVKNNLKERNFHVPPFKHSP